LREENETKMDLYTLDTNDLLVSKINFHQGAIAINKYEKIVCTTHYQPYSINRENVVDEYLVLYLRSQTFRNYISFIRAEGIKNEATYDFIGSLPIPLPPLKIQSSLVKRYNDKVREAEANESRVTEIINQIENYFLRETGLTKRAKQQSNKGLSFTKYSLISRWAISFISNLKSYDLSNACYQIIPLKKAITMFEGGKTPSTSNKSYWNGNICWTSPKDFDGFEINTTEDKITELAIKDGMKVYPEGTILGVFRSGILRHSFPVAVTIIPTAINQDIKAMDVNSEIIDKRYFLFYLHTFQKLILELSCKIGVTVESINSDEFLEVPIVLPPLPVQEKIVNEITSMHKEIQSLKSLVELNRQDAITSFEEALFKQ
jgi:type I restriction enzyme S subunit